MLQVGCRIPQGGEGAVPLLCNYAKINWQSNFFSCKWWRAERHTLCACLRWGACSAPQISSCLAQQGSAACHTQVGEGQVLSALQGHTITVWTNMELQEPREAHRKMWHLFCYWNPGASLSRATRGTGRWRDGGRGTWFGVQSPWMGDAVDCLTHKLPFLVITFFLETAVLACRMGMPLFSGAENIYFIWLITLYIWSSVWICAILWGPVQNLFPGD